MLSAVTAIRGAGDYADALSKAMEMHRRNPAIAKHYSTLADIAIRFETGSLSGERVDPKLPFADSDITAKKLSKLYIKLDLALAVARIKTIEKTITKITELFETVKEEARNKVRKRLSQNST